MRDLGREIRGRWRRAALWLLVAGLCGCVGPGAIRQTRLKYNEVIRDTNDQQLLINIVRLRYADSPVFIDLPSITSQFEVSTGSSYVGKNQSVSSNFGYGGFSARDTPTLSYHPREGREIAKALLTPLSADLFSVVNAGADLEQLLLLTLNDINDVPNAPGSTTLTPRLADDNAEFLRGIRLMAALRARQATELAISTSEEADETSDPVPSETVQGRDVLSAAQEGYAYRTRPDGKLALMKRQKELVLRIRPDETNSPEMLEIARIFHLAPGRTHYRVKSELAEDASGDVPSPLGSDTIYLNMRSVLQIMTFLSKGVRVPEEHVACGIAPTTPGPGGGPFDWSAVMAGHFRVCARRRGPRGPRWRSRIGATGSSSPRTTWNPGPSWRSWSSSSPCRRPETRTPGRC